MRATRIVLNYRLKSLNCFTFTKPPNHSTYSTTCSVLIETNQPILPRSSKPVDSCEIFKITNKRFIILAQVEHESFLKRQNFFAIPEDSNKIHIQTNFRHYLYNHTEEVRSLKDAEFDTKCFRKINPEGNIYSEVGALMTHISAHRNLRRHIFWIIREALEEHLNCAVIVADYFSHGMFFVDSPLKLIIKHKNCQYLNNCSVLFSSQHFGMDSIHLAKKIISFLKLSIPGVRFCQIHHNLESHQDECSFRAISFTFDYINFNIEIYFNNKTSKQKNEIRSKYTFFHLLSDWYDETINLNFEEISKILAPTFLSGHDKEILKKFSLDKNLTIKTCFLRQIARLYSMPIKRNENMGMLFWSIMDFFSRDDVIGQIFINSETENFKKIFCRRSKSLP